jgi:pimeloyl-ACP methyl ester carboxylesterase
MDACPVLLVHGFASSAEHNWRQPGWLDLLADAGRETIAVDLLGHGQAPRPTAPADYAAVEDRVAGAIAGREPVDAIGFSAGAHVLLHLAAEKPARFRRLALLGVGPAVFDRGPGGTASAAPDASGDARGPDGPLGAEAIIAALAGDPDLQNPHGLVLRRLADGQGLDRAALIAFLRRPQRPLAAADLARIACPVLVVLGDKDPAGPGDRLVAAFPDARLVALRGVDHFGTPADVRCMQAVLGFLDA